VAQVKGAGGSGPKTEMGFGEVSFRRRLLRESPSPDSPHAPFLTDQRTSKHQRDTQTSSNNPTRIFVPPYTNTMDPPPAQTSGMDQQNFAELLAAALKSVTVKTQGNMVINKKFDGRGITDFLENFELQAKLAGITEDEDLCNWMLAHSRGTGVYSRVKACIEDKDWKAAKVSLKKAFKIQDTKQALSLTEQLDDIFAKGVRPKPKEIAYVLEKVNAVIKRARKEGKEIDSTGTSKRFYNMLDSDWRKTLRTFFRGTEYAWDHVPWPFFFDQVSVLVEEEMVDTLNDRLRWAENKSAAVKRIIENEARGYSSDDSDTDSETDVPRPRKREVHPMVSKGAKHTDQESAHILRMEEQGDESMKSLAKSFEKLQVNSAKIDNLESSIENIQKTLEHLAQRGRPL